MPCSRNPGKAQLFPESSARIRTGKSRLFMAFMILVYLRTGFSSLSCKGRTVWPGIASRWNGRGEIGKTSMEKEKKNSPEAGASSASKSKKGNICSFCGRKIERYEPAIKGMDGSIICMNCSELAYRYYQELQEGMSGSRRAEGQAPLELKKPEEIKAFLDQYVIGQEAAKKILSVAVYNHYKRLNYMASHPDGQDTEIEKSNIILVGPTGTGKTLLARSIARLLKVPFCIADATVLTEAGYVGEDVETILSRLLQAADYDLKQTERGIVFIDEIDKIARKSSNPSITRDVSGEGVQQALLKLLEGTESLVPPKGGRKHPNADMVKINTRNILFIGSGSFDGIERHIASRLRMKEVGYRKSEDRMEVSDSESLLRYVAPQDLRAYGLIPELIGRFPVLTHLDELDKASLLNILTEPKNALVRQYKQLFAMDGVELEFDPAVYEFVVDKAIEFKLGARGLRSIMEAMMTDLMYDLPSSGLTRFRLDLDYAKQHLGRGVFDKLQNG